MQVETDNTLAQLVVRLTAAVETLEQTLPRINANQMQAAAQPLGPIVATVEGSREAELAAQLAEAEKTIAHLRASHEGRRTLPVSLLAKQESGTAEPSALDAALVSLSLEQRIAVKSQLLRAGLM